MEKSKLRKVGMGLALAAVAGLVLYTVQAPAEAPKYQTAPVERTDIENTVLATGLLEGVKQVDVGAQVSGQLKSLKVKVGDKVKKGQWLAEIDPLVLQNTLRQAQVDEENLQAQKRATQAQLKQTKAIYQRYQNLQETLRSRVRISKPRNRTRVQQANLLSLDAQIKSAHIQIDTAKVNLAYTRIVAPIDGDVVGIVTQEGQTVIANQLAPILLKLADLDTMTIKAQVSEADVIHIAPGQQVYFTILGEDKRYYGKLRGTEPAPQNFLETPPAGTPKQTPRCSTTRCSRCPIRSSLAHLDDGAGAHRPRYRAIGADRAGGGARPAQCRWQLSGAGAGRQGPGRSRATCRPGSTTTSKCRSIRA
jgi:macrolide-specific efflux system membrane fusion protein